MIGIVGLHKVKIVSCVVVLTEAVDLEAPNALTREIPPLHESRESLTRQTPRIRPALGHVFPPVDI